MSEGLPQDEEKGAKPDARNARTRYEIEVLLFSIHNFQPYEVMGFLNVPR